MNRKIGVILSYVLMVFEVLSTLLLTPFIIRTLGQAEYGVFKLTASINAYLLLLDLGVGNAIIRYIAKFRVNKDRIQERRFLGVATVFYTSVALIAVIAGIVLIAIFPSAFSKGLSPEEVSLGQKLLCITMVNSAITLATAAYNNVIIAYERFYISKGSSIIQIIVRMILTYVSLKMGMGSVGIVTVNLLMTIILRSFVVIYVFSSIRLFPMLHGVNFSFVKEIVVYSSLVLLQMVATQLNATIGHILIGSLVTSSAVILAVYGIGMQVVQYFQSIGSAFNGVLMPGLVKMVENKASPKQLTDEMARIGRIIFMILVLIWSVFVINGREFIILWAGVENEDAFYVTVILMTAYVLILSELVGSQILWAMNAHKEQAYMKISIVICNLVLTIFLIKWNPLIGATIGTFISLILGDVGVMNFIFVKKLKINLSYYYKALFKGIIWCVLISLFVGYLVNLVLPIGWIWFFVKSFVMVVVYAASMLLFGFNQYEKNLCKSIIKKIKEVN
jgi:O-antigen/teichoic acid export membrane protein